MLRRVFDGSSMDLRRFFEGIQGFRLFSSNLGCPPAHRAIPRFRIPPCTLIDPAAPKKLHPICGADTAPLPLPLSAARLPTTMAEEKLSLTYRRSCCRFRYAG